MEIFIDGDKIDFTLEEEKNLFELWVELKEFLTSNDLYAESLSCNGKSVEENPSVLEKIHINEVEKFEITTIQRLQVLITLIDASLFFWKGLREVKFPLERGALQFRQLLDDLKPLLLPTERESIVSGFSPFFQEDDSLDVPPEAMEKYLEMLEHFFRLCEARKEELIQLPNVVQKEYSQIKDSFPELEEISLLYQTEGSERGDTLLNTLFFNLQRLLFFASLLPRGEDKFWQNFSEKISPFLQELEQAYQNRDTILIGDLITYEILPLLKEEPTTNIQ